MFESLTNKIAMILARIPLHLGNGEPDTRLIIREIERYKASARFKDMADGRRYYRGEHDILSRERTAIGEGGEPAPVSNIPNARIVDNQYRKMVDQKCNYLLGKPLTIQSDDGNYAVLLKNLFGAGFQRTLKNIGLDSINCGIGWMFTGYNADGELTFTRMDPLEIIPGWADAEHENLLYAIRLYNVRLWENGTERTAEKVEIYTEAGVTYYELSHGMLLPEEPFHAAYVTTADGTGLNWSRIPLIAFKRDQDETPLIRQVRSLQDGLNQIESDFQNGMEEDPRNTILVLKNYDGENLGEFRKNLATYGAVKVRTVDGADGGIDTLQIEVNSENYKSVIELFKKAIIENAFGYDAKDDRLSGNPNQMNIQSMYSDIDLDANGMEMEYQAAFEKLLWFVDAHLANTGKGNFDGVQADIIFNRDMLISETDIINNIRASQGIISDETLIAQHPWVDDAEAELKRVKKQKKENIETFGDIPAGDQNGEGTE